jgi:hypothetical protein
MKLILTLLFNLFLITIKADKVSFVIPKDSIQETKDCDTGNIYKWDGKPLKELKHSVRNNNCSEIILTRKKVDHI